MRKMKKLSLLALLLACTLTTQAAGKVTMKTSKATGEKIAIAVNANVPLTLTWGDGTVVETVATGALQEFDVKNASLTLSSTSDITSLYVAENDLTELSVTGVASTLRRLFCAGNQLKTLNLSTCTSLVSLDCQGNSLSTLKIGSTKMEDVNIADNQLSTNGLSAGSRVVSMVCANNKMSIVSNLASMTGLTSLFCQGNQISALTATKCTELRYVLAGDNKLKAFDAKPLTKLEELWVGGNSIETLDFSDNPTFVGLSAENNQLSQILWNRNCSSTFKYVDLSNNALFFGSFPTIYNNLQKIYTVDGTVAPQNDYQLFGDQNLNERTESLQSIIGYNGWNRSTAAQFTMVDANGQQLAEGTDYNYSSYRFTFLKPHNGVVLTATSVNYPDMELKTKPFNILDDPSGIETVETIQDTDAPVYDLSGRRIDGSAQQKGIYIVKGKKVVIR